MTQTAKRNKRPAKTAEDIFWISQTREVSYPLDEPHPIFVEEEFISGKESASQPRHATPERHPYCEFTITLKGSVVQYICGEKIERGAGDIMLLGPGTPHWATHQSRPCHSISVYFLPVILFEMGPNGDGSWILSRFTEPENIAQRVITPPLKLGRELSRRAQDMVKEFKSAGAGSELRLRVMLMESLVAQLRWEIAKRMWVPGKSHPPDWGHLEKAVHYIHQHYSEPLYVDQIAVAVGLSPNQLRSLFRQTLGLSCSDYLQSVRVAQAKARLSVPDAQITNVSLSVGFETLSNFNATFRAQTGMSPSQFMRSRLYSAGSPDVKNAR